MAFQQLGPVFLKSGESVWVTITFGSGEDHGAQWIMAHPESGAGVPGNNPNWGTSQCEVSRFQIRSNLFNQIIPELFEPQRIAYFTYNCLVTCTEGFNDTWFTLTGGGN